jgi:hypothetical protein
MPSSSTKNLLVFRSFAKTGYWTRSFANHVSIVKKSSSFVNHDMTVYLTEIAPLSAHLSVAWFESANNPASCECKLTIQGRGSPPIVHFCFHQLTLQTPRQRDLHAFSVTFTHSLRLRS